MKNIFKVRHVLPLTRILFRSFSAFASMQRYSLLWRGFRCHYRLRFHFLAVSGQSASTENASLPSKQHYLVT